ncbi:hypothetical protein [Caldithrix abyssi]|uniref:Uncharacterized protein n=1 Tax=Caldithrix abyssi DSM 13497 TaxID=880073 RepID=A0A1J1C8A8_CALAY|nr:hypothetical protein [Caldithrix abyssi]APF18879.1 hypothetical protein Cabys_2130 [Caldithrix abyssi DSM 13497]
MKDLPSISLPFFTAPFGYAQGAGVRLLSVAENRLLSEVENRLLSVVEATVDL